MCGGSPLFKWLHVWLLDAMEGLMSGRLQERRNMYTLVLPSVRLLEVKQLLCVVRFQCRGDYRRGDILLYSRSPLSGFFLVGFYCFELHVGENTQVGVFNILVLPSMNRNTVLHHLISLILKWGILAHFSNHQFCMHFRVTSDTQWWGACHDPYTMYIYSLGHFLTTKGALIDGD